MRRVRQGAKGMEMPRGHGEETGEVAPATPVAMDKVALRVV